MLNWFCDYLSSRQQRVVIDGVSSSFLGVTSGVPQGNVVGPLLFIIYVNKIPNETTHSKTPMFADDSKYYRQITSTDDEQLLQRDINSLQEWSVKWELSFNVQKCSAMWFTRKKNVMPANYHLANEEIKSVKTQKDLGIFISDDLKWSNQIAHVVAKANRMLGFLRRHCTQFTNIHCRRLLYLTLFLSYSSEIWSPQASSRDLVLIEGIQRRATKFITQDYNSSYSSRLKSLNLLPISYWFEIKDLTFYYKCKFGGYKVDVNQYSTQPSLHTTRFSSSDLTFVNPQSSDHPTSTK